MALCCGDNLFMVLLKLGYKGIGIIKRVSSVVIYIIRGSVDGSQSKPPDLIKAPRPIKPDYFLYPATESSILINIFAYARKPVCSYAGVH